MDKKEQREKRTNFILLGIACLLVVGLLLIYREGLTWFSSTRWSDVSVLRWVAIGSIIILSLLVQYYFFLLLRYSFFKYLVLWFIPIAWLFNNGIVAMHRFLDWTTDIISPAGWIPLGDLLGWLLSAVFFPVLVGGGAVVAIIDSSSSMLTQACYYAGIAMDVASVSPSNIFSYSLKIINVFWDVTSNAFVQEVFANIGNDRSLLSFNLSHTFALPYWILSIGYSFTCIVI